MILDTHVWIFYATERRLSKRGLSRIERARRAGQLRIAAVTLWEVAHLVQERRLRLAEAAEAWFRDALARTEVIVAPLSIATAIAGARLIHALRDPADCQIAGTAITMGVPLATRDARILENAETLGIDVVEV